MITMVYAYYDNGGMLERHLDEWSSYSDRAKQSFKAIIIDDGSEKDPAAPHMRDPGFHVELCRIKQNIPWNIPGARNLGMTVASEGWCLLSDIDHLLPVDQADKLLGFPRKPKHYYLPARQWADGTQLKPHPNTYVLEKSLYWQAGGCDEDWSGSWGAGEHNFRRNLELCGTRVETREFYLSHFGRDDIPDASTREWGRKHSQWDWAKNPKLVERHRNWKQKPSKHLRFDWERVDWHG